MNKFTSLVCVLLIGISVNAQIITMGATNTLVQCTDSVFMTWGNNGQGVMGIGTTDLNFPEPIEFPDLLSVSFLKAESSNTFFIKPDGSVWGWGSNSYEQLGDNTTTNRYEAVQIHGLNDVGYLSDISFISAAENSFVNSYAIKTDGTVLTWGFNHWGTLGNGNYLDSGFPVQVVDTTGTGLLSDIIELTGGMYSIEALKSDGSVYAWGYNDEAALGTLLPTYTNIPQRVPVLSDIIHLTSTANSCIALKADGTVWYWGGNDYGKCGDSSIHAIKIITPIQVPGIDHVVQIEAGQHTIYALKDDGTVWSWGYGANGQLGIGTNENRTYPVMISSLSNVITIEAGFSTAIAREADGSVWSWGLNNLGVVGDGTFSDRWSPVKIEGLCMPLAIQNNAPETQSVGIFPNPSNGICKIITKEIFNGNIEIYDQTGQLVKSQLFYNADPYIDLTNYSAGTYLIKVVSNKNVLSGILIKH